MDNVFDKVDKTKETSEQFHEFAIRAEALANTIKENILSLFSTIEQFQKGCLDSSDCQPPYSREKLIQLASKDLLENLQLKHALVVLQGKDYIFKTLRYDFPATTELRNYISEATK